MTASLNYALGEVSTVGSAIARTLRAGDALGLCGDIGAGKTTMVRAILASLGLVGDAPSPSFAIVQPYGPPEISVPLLHIDLYRVNDIGELAELGLDEARDDHILLIEWPQLLVRSGWEDMAMIHIDGMGNAPRHLTAQLPDAWIARWPFPQ